MASGPVSGGRRFNLLRLIFGPLLVLLVCGLSPAHSEKIYTNQWAVHIPGGPEEADQIASKYGFINHGHVSNGSCFLSLFWFCERTFSRFSRGQMTNSGFFFDCMLIKKFLTS